MACRGHRNNTRRAREFYNTTTELCLYLFAESLCEVNINLIIFFKQNVFFCIATVPSGSVECKHVVKGGGFFVGGDGGKVEARTRKSNRGSKLG